MKSTDLRAKARAIFGSAIAEPMPNQPNGAKALQQRANARPIPTYKVGGVVKKADGGTMKPKVSTAERKMGDALMMTRKGKEIMNAQKRMEDEKEMQRRKKQEAADRLLGIRMKNGGSVEKKADGGLLDRLGRAISDIANEGKTKKYGITVGGVPRGSAGRPARNETDGAGSGSNAPVTVARREESVTVNPNPPKEKPKYVKLNEKPKYVKLNAHKDGGKVQTSADTAKKLATEMGGMKKGGKAKDGLAVMIAIGKVKKPAKKMGGGMMYADGGKPGKMAVGGAGKTRKGQAPIKKAQGGAAKVRKGMMSPTGDIKQVVKPKKGLGGM